MSNGEGEGRYWWWNLSELDEEGYQETVERMGRENLREEFHPQDKGKERKLVDRRTGEVCGSYNRAHSCPPDCE